MANRYWVGGTGNWNETTHWSTSDGGSSGASVPTSADDVFFTQNSFSGTGQIVTCGAYTCSAKSMDWTGVLNSPTLTLTANWGLYLYGYLKLVSGMTVTVSGGSCLILFGNSSGTYNITTANRLNNNITFRIQGQGDAIYSLQDSCTLHGIELFNGIITTNNNNITATYFSIYNGATYSKPSPHASTLNGGTSTITCRQFALTDTTNITVNVVNTNFVISQNLNFQAGTTFNSVTFRVEDIYNDMLLLGSNTINTINIESNVYRVRFQEGKTQYVTNFNARGTAGNLILIQSSASSPTTLSCASGIVNCDFLKLGYITATGGATWYAGSHSINLGNNSGWLFTDASNAVFFGAAF